MTEENNEGVNKNISANRLATLVQSLDSHLDNFRAVINQTYEQSEIDDLDAMDEMVKRIEELSGSLSKVTDELGVKDYYEED